MKKSLITIIFERLKNNYTKNEVIQILKLRDEYQANELSPYLSLDKWIELNL